MSNRLKLKFLGNMKPSETEIINILTTISPVSLRDIYMAQGYAMVIFNNPEDIDKITTNEGRQQLDANQLRAVLNNGNTANRTVFVTKIRPFPSLLLILLMKLSTI